MMRFLNCDADLSGKWFRSKVSVDCIPAPQKRETIAARPLVTVQMPSENNPLAPVIRRRTPKSQRRRDGLIQYAFDVTSQNGEDGILGKIFNDILPPIQANERRYCVDVGAWDGKHLSNTFSLLIGETPRSCLWKGILIEADPDKFRELKHLHDPFGNTCVNTMVSSDPESSDSLVSVLKREAPELPKDFDFLCIDVDGSDYWLLHEVFQHQYRPKLICIESNPTMPNDLICTSITSECESYCSIVFATGFASDLFPNPTLSFPSCIQTFRQRTTRCDMGAL